MVQHPHSSDTSITIYKYTCPEGYNVHEVGANPEVDCPDLTNGITFKVERGGAFYSQSDTGDSIPGAVYFGGLEADDYHVVEMLPDGTVALQVNCKTTTPEGLPSEFSFSPDVSDPSIDLTLVKGQVIVCHWFNDPYKQPKGGHMKVVKYWCDGAVYTVEACDIWEGGASFVVDSASAPGSPISFTTRVDGTWTLDLAAGVYTIDEQGAQWCYASADITDAEGSVIVNDSATTEVDVFNCGPRDKGKNPPIKKFPNTGIGPIEALGLALFA
ncbi:MAG: hypothetical protein ACJ789_16865 [Thermomicrobiales bacterium]